MVFGDINDTLSDSLSIEKYVRGKITSYVSSKIK
jgi:hypothetical protein